MGVERSGAVFKEASRETKDTGKRQKRRQEKRNTCPESV